MKQKIVSRWNPDRIIFECEVPDDVESGLAMRHALEKAVAQRPRIVLSGADLRGADLRGADLRDADLRDAVLSGADLSDAVLSYAVLRGADLRGAVLSGADLSDAVLSYAVLSDAVLSDADLSDAVLSDADLSDAVLSDADGKPLPRATPEQAIENLDKVRAIVLDDKARLEMGHWHGDNDWKGRTCAEEAVCGTTHCMAGWLQVCTTEPALKEVEAHTAGVCAAPIAAKMFFRGQKEALEWLTDRKYVAETEEAERRSAARKAKREAAGIPTSTQEEV